MKKEKIYYLCLLGNVDESVLKLNSILNHGFEIKEIDFMEETFKNIQEFERLKDTAGISNRLTNDYDCMPYTKVYGIQNSFDVTVNDVNIVTYDKSDRILKDEYVNSLIRKMRLFKEGNLRIAIVYHYFKTKDGKVRLNSLQTSIKSEYSEFKLEDSELPKLKEFFKDFEIPFDFEKPFLQSAFELFELSYYTYNYDILALLLFMSMEVLFKSNKNCNATCISKNITAFFENDQTDLKESYCKMLKYWKTRNNIAHEGTSKLNRNELRYLIRELRQYVRDSIVKMNDLKQNKDEILKDLNFICKIDCNE